jgi:hypothetical protein
MIKLKDILTERISDIVYHFTSPDAATLIIRQNRFKLAPIPVGQRVDPGKKYEDGYFMSVARTKIEGYTKLVGDSKCKNVRMELDGAKMGNTLKGGAYNYFHGQHGKDDYEEYEDRVYSRKQYIDNALGYIKRIDVYWDNRCEIGFNFVKTALENNIPTFLFAKREKWAQQSGGIEVRDMDGYTLFMQKRMR